MHWQVFLELLTQLSSRVRLKAGIKQKMPRYSLVWHNSFAKKGAKYEYFM
jgi:hypothetical protein